MPSEGQQSSDALERLLDKFKNDLWIQRRLALDEVIESLKMEFEKHDKLHRNNKVTQKFQDYIRFIEFLKDQCTGQHFTSDKQWGHLLNLMSVSRRVNHRSAKFSDIISRKHHIESSFQDIRNFNESVKQASIIDDTLAVLDNNLESCELAIKFSNLSSESSQQSLNVEVSRAIRLLENTSGPLICNLRMQLYSKSIDPMFERDRLSWRDTFSRLESIFSSLSQLLINYQKFIKDFSELRPFLQTVEGCEKKSSDSTRPVQRDDTLQAQLTYCKAEFNRVIDFDRKLTEFFSIHVKQKPSVSKSSNQQVRSLNLRKLLDSKLRFKDEMLTAGLEEAHKRMRSCQDTLTHIKRNLRLEFGRFYFLNDLELLSLIALDARLVEECDQSARRRLIRKMFNNSIEGFSLSDEKVGPRFITGVTSSIGENIDLGESNWVPLKKRVNIYSLEVVRILNEVLRKLRRSLKLTLQKSIESWTAQSRYDLRSPMNDIDWSLPIQLLDLAEYVKFTHRVEAELSLESPKLASLIEFYESRLRGLWPISDVGNCDENNPISKLKISAATSITVHFIALLINLNESSVCSLHDWNWKKLQRFYPKDSTNTDLEGWNLEVKIATATFVYRFDLLSIETTSEIDIKSQGPVLSVKRLISTTTSDRCFLAASQAISSLKSGASPFGPAGSGKTETIKALGRLFGCQVIVHNCDEANDSESLERLIWGLAHTGLWGCFDEFNRLSASTLSSVSSVLELVQASLSSGSLTIELDDGEIKSIDPNSAFFVTLNPGDGSRYLGRRRLPANLRSLFIPVSMYHVQLDAIVRQMLLVHSSSSNRTAGLQTISGHFDSSNSSEIARTFSRWVQVARKELARSNRCEFDLRLVLVIMKRTFRLLAESSQVTSNPTAQLYNLMISSIQAEVCPRLEERQLNALEKTLSDCFGSISIRPKQEARIELKAQLEGRSGVILLGATQTGKSRSWRTLLAELNRDGQTICCSTINPKAYDKDRLFGYFEASSGKWVDGIFTKLVRVAVSKLHNMPDLQEAWIILDGDIDPDWIECLNSVLDDNQVLTLSSGERIDFVVSSEKCIKLIFETGSIQYTSPATISRLGLVYHEKIVAQGAVNRDFLPTTIVHSGDSRSRLAEAETIAGLKQRSVVYGCNELCNADSLIKLICLSSDSPCSFIIQNLDLIRSEDEWGSKTFVELLRYIITYKRYYDRDLNEIDISAETKLIITVDSVAAIADKRLVAIADTREVKRDVHEIRRTSYKTADFFVREALLGSKEGSGILIILNEHAVGIKEEVISSIKSNHQIDIDFYRFNNEVNKIRSIEKLEKLSAMKNTMGIDGGRKCIFLIDSLEIYLMNEQSKRRMYDLINLLSIRRLFGANTKILVCLDNLAKPDTEFWLSMGQSYTIAPTASCAKRFEDLFEKRVGAKKDFCHLEWLSREVARISFGKEAIIQDHFVDILVEMIVAMKEGLRHRTRMLKSGLDKLREFGAHVEEIKLKKQQEDVVLREQKLEIEKLMRQIDLELERSERKRVEVERLQVELKDKSVTLEAQTREIQSELDLVLPLIESSKREVAKCLKPEALNEIKTLRAPPKTIKDILDVVFVFLDVQDTSWASIKAYLTRVSLKDELTNYDFGKRLDCARLEKINCEIELRRDSFQEQQAKRASNAILPILNWINSALEYGKVSVKLKPLTEARDRLKSEAEELTRSMGELERDRKQLAEKVAEDGDLLKKYEADYLNAKSAAERMTAELTGAGKIIDNSARQVSSWRRRLAKLEALATNEKDLYQICLVCAFSTIWAESLDELGELLKSFGHRLKANNHLDIFIAFAQDNVNILLDIIDVEPIETSTVKADELHSLLQLIRLKMCLLVKSKNLRRLPFIQFGKLRTKIDESFVSALSARNVVCSSDELLVVRPEGGTVGSWRQSFDLGLKMNKLLAVQFDAPDLDVVDAVLEHCHDTRIVLFGGLTRERALGNPLSRLYHIFSIDQQSAEDETNSLSNQIAKLILKQCEPKIGSEMSELEWSLMMKQREQRSLEASLLKNLHQSSADNDIQSLSVIRFQSDLVKSLNQLQKASDSLGVSILEIKNKLADFQKRQTEYSELSSRLAKFQTNFLSPLQEKDDFYTLSTETLVELLLMRSPFDRRQENTQIVFGEWQLSQILTRAMSSLRPECRAEFNDQLMAESGELAALLNAADKADVGKIVESSYKTSADLCHNLINLLSIEGRDKGRLIKGQRERKFDLVVILHDVKKPSPQVVVDEFFRHGRSTFIAKDNECHYHKVYGRSQRQAAGANASSINQRELQQPLEAHLRRLMMSSCLGATTSIRNSNQQAQTPIQTKCICIANAHLSASWINAQLLELLTEITCRRNDDERYVLLLIGESSERQASESPDAEPSDKLDLNLLEAASLKFWYDELALNALDRYNLYLGSLCDAYVPDRNLSKGGRKTKAPDDESGSLVIVARKQFHAEPAEKKGSKNANSELIEDLVMFHVVCQELIRLGRLCAPKLSQGGLALWQKIDYNFDYEQLSAALKIWNRINNEQVGTSESVDEPSSKRQLFCHLLESIVYGSRLETLEDEELLALLLNRFMQIPPLSDTVRRRRLIALERLAHDDLSASVDGISSARYANELAGLIRVLE